MADGRTGPAIATAGTEANVRRANDPGTAAPGRGGPSRRWLAVLWLGGSGAALLGLLAWATDGQVRAACLTLLMAVGLGIAALASHRSVPTTRTPVGGAGYEPPTRRRFKALHVAITGLYNLGVFTVVLAALVRANLAPVEFPPGLLRAFPLFLAVDVFLLVLAIHWRVRERGGVVRNWSTRVHGWGLGVAGGLVILVGTVLTLAGGIAVGAGELTDADLQVLVLAGILGLGTQIYLVVSLPTVFDLARTMGDVLGKGRKVEPGTTPPFVYALLLALGGTLVVGYLLTQFDVLAQLGHFRNERVILLLALFPVGLALFFIASAVQIYRESKRGLYTKKVSTKLRNDILVYGVSGTLGLLFAGLLMANLSGSLPDIGPWEAGLERSKDLIALTILSTAGPIGMYVHRQHRRTDNIEARLPDFLNDLAETRRAGLTLTASLQSTALSDYGDLTPEIQKMANQVGWGVPFTEALAQFAQRVKTGLVQRSAYLIIEASKTGGSVAEILKAAAKDAYEIKALEGDRRVGMLTYLIVIYVVFFVFMTVIAVLDVQFIPEVLKANEAVSASGSAGSGFGGGSTGIDREGIRFVYFNAAIVQAIGNGIVGGVLSEGRVTAGLRHVAIMSFVSWMLFRFALGAM